MNIIKQVLFFMYTNIIMCVMLFLTTEVVVSQEKNDVEPIFEKELYIDYFTLKHMPDSPFAVFINKMLQKVKPNVGGEMVYSFEAVPQSKLTEEQLDEKMFAVLLNVETLKGILYYSSSRKKYREFVRESYRVDSLKDKNKIDIVSMSDIQTFLVEENSNIVKYEFFLYQEDSSFGRGVKKVTMYYNKILHEIYMYITNLESIKYKNFIRIAQPNTLALVVLVQRKGNVYNEYMMVGVRTKNTLQSIKEKVSKSLIYRMYAMGIWFENEIKKVL